MGHLNGARSPAERVAAILERVLPTCPKVVLMQEVTIDTYVAIKRILIYWQVYRRHEQAEEYV